jgi:DNA-binding GntR family transcriptional regulator
MPAQDSKVEAIYQEVKQELLSGRILPGQRINIKALCEAHGVSKSPIRNILNRLVGEGLLDVHAHDGFYRPRLTVQLLHEMYNWEQDIVLLAIRDTDPTVPSSDAVAADALEDDIEVVLRRIVTRSGNNLYQSAFSNITDRLRAIRRSKRENLFETQTEIAALTEAFEGANPEALRRRLRNYYHRRLLKLSDIVADAYRGRPQ